MPDDDVAVNFIFLRQSHTNTPTPHLYSRRAEGESGQLLLDEETAPVIRLIFQYGSEFLNALSMYLGCRSKLKKIGRPTIVICDVPLADISKVWLNGLEEAVESGDSSIYLIAVSSVAPQI